MDPNAPQQPQQGYAPQQPYYPQQGYAPQQGSPQQYPPQQYPQQYPPQQYPPQQYPPQQYPPQQYPPQQNYAPNIVTVPAMLVPGQNCVYQQNMRYRIQEDWYTLGGNMTIFDQNGAEAFHVVGEIFSIGTKMSFRDVRNGHEYAHISQNLRIGMPHFEILKEGRHFATIKQRFQLLSHKFEIEIVGSHSQDLTVKGDWSAYDFQFFRGNRWVGAVSKAYFNIRDVYGIEIVAGEDVILLLACVVVIDKCTHGDSHRGGGGSGVVLGGGGGSGAHIAVGGPHITLGGPHITLGREGHHGHH